MEMTTNEINKVNFQTNPAPSISRRAGRAGSIPNAASKIPAGQMYWQKIVPICSAANITAKINSTYFKYDNARVTGLFLSFGVLILWSKS